MGMDLSGFVKSCWAVERCPSACETLKFVPFLSSELYDAQLQNLISGKITKILLYTTKTATSCSNMRQKLEKGKIPLLFVLWERRGKSCRLFHAPEKWTSLWEARPVSHFPA